VLSEFVAYLTPAIMAIKVNTTQQENEERERMRIQDEENKRKLKLMEEKQRSMENQLAAKERTENVKDKRGSRKDARDKDKE
jgi:hypothetical protein